MNILWITILTIMIAGVLFNAVAPACAAASAEAIDLSGKWRVQLDPDNVGVDARWFDQPVEGAEVQLPGALRDNGIGHDVGPHTKWIGDVREEEWSQPRYAPYRTAENFRMPFWLQPDRRYLGPAWYEKTVTVPEEWRGRRITLRLERPHWHTMLWINGEQAGENDSLSVPHVYDLTDRLGPGEHRITLRIDNSLAPINVGPNSHSVSDHTQSAWHGVVGELALRAEPPIWIDDIQLYPDARSRTVEIRIALGNVTDAPAVASLTIRARPHGSMHADDAPLPPAQRVEVPIDADGGSVTLTYAMGDDALLWDEFQPALYELEASLEVAIDEDAVRDTSTTRFGLRDITTRGTQFVINDRATMMRGTLECAIFPTTGYPPTDVASWKRIIRICQAHGLNHIRFHSWCPPEAAFVAADELGCYLQVECSSWANQGAELGTGQAIDAWLYREADRIIRAHGNHPSFMLFAYGNEPTGKDRTYLATWVDHYKQMLRGRQLVTSAAGWPLIDQSQFHVDPRPRIQAWGEGLNSRVNALPPATTADYRELIEQYPSHPYIAHETGQWCAFPNFDEINKYTGPLKAKNFELFRTFLDDQGMLDQARDFLMASGMLQTLCYKEELEAALRTPGFGGFQMLQLHDFPGQGTALVGLLDPFFDVKPYHDVERFREFCGPIVPLARLPQRVFTSDEPLVADVELAHFGPADLEHARLRWELIGADGRPLRSGELDAGALATGALHQVGRIEAPLTGISTPAQLELVIHLLGTEVRNRWTIWIYPPQVDVDAPPAVHLAWTFDDVAEQVLRDGGTVMLLPDPKLIDTHVKIGFSSIFWNSAWTGHHPPNTLGVLVDPEHPALARFETRYHSDWQWWDLVAHSAAMEMDDLPAALRPIVQVVPDWFDPKRLGLVFEAKVASGKLLVCSIDLASDLERRPVARQFRHSLLRYVADDAFQPQHELTWEQVRGLFRTPSPMQALGAKATGSGAAPGFELEHVLDGDASTFWHTVWAPTPVPHPHELVIDLRRARRIRGVTYLPRQEQSNGRIARYRIYISLDGHTWSQPVAEGEWPDTAQRQRVDFDRDHAARYVRLVALKEVNDKPYTSVAELAVIPTDGSRPAATE